MTVFDSSPLRPSIQRSLWQTTFISCAEQLRHQFHVYLMRCHFELIITFASKLHLLSRTVVKIVLDVLQPSVISLNGLIILALYFVKYSSVFERYGFLSSNKYLNDSCGKETYNICHWQITSPICLKQLNGICM